MNLRRLAAVAALFALPVAATMVFSGAEVFDGQSYRQQLTGSAIVGIRRSDSAAVIPSFDGGNNLLVTEAAPAYTNFLDGSTPIIDDSTAIGMADSSTVLSMGQYRIHALAIRMQGNPATYARLAIQIRYHLNAQSDTASVFPWLPRSTHATVSTDSLNYGGVVAPTSVAYGRSEFVVTVADDRLVASKWGSQANVYIELRDVYGTLFWAPYVSVRIRNLHMNVAVGDGNDNVPQFKVYALGAS